MHTTLTATIRYSDESEPSRRKKIPPEGVCLENGPSESKESSSEKSPPEESPQKKLSTHNFFLIMLNSNDYGTVQCTLKPAKEN